MFGNVGTYGGDGQSTASNACDHGIRSDDFLRWRKRDLEQQQPRQQRLDTGRRYHSFDFSDDERHIFRCRQQWRLYFCAFECNHGNRESIAFYAHDYTIRPDDILYGWQREPDFDRSEQLSLEPRREYSADCECECERFLYRPSDRRQWLFGNVGTYGGDGQSTASNACDHGIRSDDFLRWRKRDLEQQQPRQQRLDTGRRYHSFDFSDDERHIFRCRQQWRLYLCAFE